MKKTNTSISDRVLAKITDEHITPKPRWGFLVHRYAMWAVSLLAVFTGGVAVSGALFVSLHSGYEMYLATHGSLGAFMFSSMPYLWIAALILFATIAYYNIRHTEGGYRYSFSVLLASVVVGSLALGAVLFALGAGKLTDEKMARIAPFYKPIATLQVERWDNPAEGRLAGVVSEGGAVSLTVKTFSGAVYTIDTSDLRGPDLAVIERAEMVRIVGVATTSSTNFHACFIIPWELAREYSPKEQRQQQKEKIAYMHAQKERNVQRSQECQSIRPFKQVEKLQGRNR